KLLAWLKSGQDKRLVVLAYDDRNIMLDGKKVVSDTGGTFRATHRMIDRFSNDVPLQQSRLGVFGHWVGLDGRVDFLIHPNPENKILHTLLVGEMNGFLYAMTLGTPQETAWGRFASGERAYGEWIQPAVPTIAPMAAP